MKNLLGAILIIIFSVSSYDVSKMRNDLNMNAVNCEFFPCLISNATITLNTASIKKYSVNEIIIICNNITYTWKDKSILYKDTKNLGCYQLLCVTWNFGFDLIF